MNEGVCTFERWSLVKLVICAVLAGVFSPTPRPACLLLLLLPRVNSRQKLVFSYLFGCPTVHVEFGHMHMYMYHTFVKYSTSFVASVREPWSRNTNCG